MANLTQTTAEIQSNLDWHISKAEGAGIKVDPAAPTFGWQDLESVFLPDTANPTTSPSMEVFRTGVKGYAFDASDEVVCNFHVPHDWVPNHDALCHIHWAHNGTNVAAGNLTVSAIGVYGDRGGNFGAPITLATISHAMVDISTTPQYCHHVTEVPLCMASPSANEFDSNDINVDGLFQITFKVTNLPTITGGDLFIFNADMHYQTTNIGTKQNAAPFYT